MNIGKIGKKMLIFIMVSLVLQTAVFADGHKFNVYGVKETMNRKSDPVFKLEREFPQDFGKHVTWYEDGNDENMVNTFNNFLGKYMPEKYHNLDVYIVPYWYKGARAFYTDDKRYSNRPTIVIAVPENIGIGSFYHELGHMVSYEELDEKGWTEYEERLKKVGLKDDQYADDWDLSIKESFAEDFKAYVLYSIHGLSFTQASKQKSGVYPFTHETIEYFDLLFPKIKKERLRRIISNRAMYSSWAKKDIEDFLDSEIILYEFDFTQDLTRYQFANMAVQMYEIKKGEIKDYENKFEDIDEECVSKAAAVGIIKGRSDTIFDPNDKITREEIYIIVDRLQNLLDKKIRLDRTIRNRSTTLQEAVAIINRFL